MPAAGFRVVTFSPDPEEMEFINVALLVWTDGALVVEADPEFPRLRSFYGDALPTRLILEALASVEVAESEPGRVERLGLLGAQFRVGGFRETRRMDTLTLDIITRKYLAPARIPAAASRGEGE